MYRGRTSHAVAILNRQMMMMMAMMMVVMMMAMVTMAMVMVVMMLRLRWDSGGTPLRVTLSPAFLGLKSRGGYR